jgi:type II secretory pathway pseudopilin PulG
MIIVIAIIAILIALIAPNLVRYLDTANQRKVDAAAKTLYTAVNSYVVEQRAEGNAVDTSTEWKVTAGSAPGTGSIDTVLSEYFNDSEILTGGTYKMSCTVTLKSTNSKIEVVSAVWEENGAGTGNYPK